MWFAVRSTHIEFNCLLQEQIAKHRQTFAGFISVIDSELQAKPELDTRVISHRALPSGFRVVYFTPVIVLPDHVSAVIIA
jgi:hypothetical protein